MENEYLKKWVNEFTTELYKWAYYKTSSNETAEDLVQEVFLVASEKIETFKGDSSAKTWLFSILNHKIIDYYRKKVNQPVSIEKESFLNFFTEDGSWQEVKSPKEWHEEDTNLLDDNDFQLILQKCLDALPDKWSTCVKLKYLSEKNGDEICQELGITSSNFWQIVHRAKLQLRNCIENNWFKNSN